MGRLVSSAEMGIVDEDRSVRGWAEALRSLCLRPERRAAMGRAAREFAETLPSWEDVLREDLMPWWQKSAARKRAAGRA
jgi:glycosyltransferase involved in cell wall biosynthesis